MKIYFDLDGTLTDPGIGIGRCIQYALASLGASAPDLAALRRCVGPPLRASLSELLATDDSAVVDRAIVLYRERFSTIGLFENALCPDVVAGLERLVACGCKLWVVTSKPTVYAERIIAHFGIGRFFEGVYGSELSGINADKVTLIREALEREGHGADPWMVGDREQDIRGALANGLVGIGALWGYGTECELRDAGATHVVLSIGQLADLVGRPTMGCS